MLLPFPENKSPASPPFITWALIGSMLLVSLAQIAVTRNGSLPTPGFALLAGVTPVHYRLYTFITYTFVHGNTSHLLINLFYLMVFGPGVEAAIGRLRYLALYIGGGVFGAALQVLVALKIPGLLNPSIPIVGASAACSCLVGLYAVRYYRDRITFVGLPYRPTVVEVVTLFICIETGIGVWQIFVGMASDGVAHWAHIGGFVFGLTCAYLLKLDNTGEEAYWKLDAAMALDNSQPGAAIARLEQILSRDNSNGSARADLARAWLDFGDMDQASDHFINAIRCHLTANRRRDAAEIYLQMRESLPQYGADVEAAPPTWTSKLTPQLEISELFIVGTALEEMRSYDLAAEALRAVAVRAPESTEAETALLRAAGLYINYLQRSEEAGILLTLFLERHPNSQLRHHAEELFRTAQSGRT